jgi:PAS domain S-box-containing protein
MKNGEMSREQLIAENEELRCRLAALDGVERQRRLALGELAMFRRFAEASSQGFSMADLDGRLLYLNPALSRMLEEDEPEQRIGQHLSLYYSEEGNRRGKEEIEPALRAHGHWEGEIPMLTRRGKSIPTWQHSFLIRDERGTPLRMAVVITDISERLAAENALRTSEERFRIAFEDAPMGIVIGVAGGVLTRVNRAFCQMSGYSEAELIGTSIHELSHPDDRHRSEDLVRQVDAGKIPRFSVEKRYLKKDGSVFWAQVTSAGVRDRGGHVVFGMGIIEDITRRKCAEEALRESELKLATLFEMLPVGISILNDQRRIVAWNPALERILGLSGESLLRADYADRQLLRSDGSQLPPEEVPSEVALREKRVVSDTVVGVVKEEGAVIWTNVGVAPLPLPGLSAALVVSDITEGKKAHESLQKAHRTLKHLLQSSDHERQVIAYDIHDGLAQQLAGALMQLQAFTHLNGRQPKEAADALHACATMLRQSHFEARRLIAGVRPPVLDELGVAEAIGHLVNERSRLKEPTIEYRSSVSFDRLAPTLENALYRICQEALANACQYSQSRRVRVSLTQQDEHVRLEIHDWGVGFEPRAVPASHFGLEGIRQRARLLGGRASIRSVLGKGTRIAVELPLVPREPE